MATGGLVHDIPGDRERIQLLEVLNLGGVRMVVEPLLATRVLFASWTRKPKAGATRGGNHPMRRRYP